MCAKCATRLFVRHSVARAVDCSSCPGKPCRPNHGWGRLWQKNKRGMGMGTGLGGWGHEHGGGE
eukprot:7073501-Lingulodinium_polyedra.AAC.1